MLARLPVPAAPARHETLASYLSRLAALHGMPARELWEPISRPRPGTNRRDVIADRLAALVGRARDHLAYALPELRDPIPDWTAWRHQPQPGCPRCDARHDGGPVLRLLPHHRYVCTRHRHWIGPPDAGEPATPLGRDGEVSEQIVRAQHQHRRLLARHGPAAAFDAVLTGFLICGHLWDDRRRESTGAWHQWVRRVDQLIPPGTEATTYRASLLFAAVYPEAVSIASLIASPAWRRLAGGYPAQQHQFLVEACRRVGRVPNGDYSNNVIRHWMIFDSHHPPSRPVKTFPETREHGAIRLTNPSPASFERTIRGALWFAKNRLGGGPILHHRHIRPVLARDWATKMDGMIAIVPASASLFDRDHARRCNIPIIGESARLI
jgi:TniQ